MQIPSLFTTVSSVLKPCVTSTNTLITADSASTNAMPVKISLMRLPFVTEGFVKKGVLVPEGEKSKNREKVGHD